MTEDPSFQMSQGYEVLPPKSGKAYPILCEEWDFLKKQIGSLSQKINIYHTIGSLLLGASITTFISILTGAFSNLAVQSKTAVIIAWATVVVTLICGGLSMFFSREQQKINTTQASDVKKQMEIIENRYKAEE